VKRLILAGFLVFLIGCKLEPARRVSIDDVLHRPDARHGTFGPTGKRLFTERLDPGLGLRGQFCYIHHADIRDPIYLELRDRGKVLPQKIAQTDWYPSHLTVQSRIGNVDVFERKFITDNDTMVEQLHLTNPSKGPVEYDLRLTSGFARDLQRVGSKFTTVDLATVANAHPFPGFDIFTGLGADPFRAWYEAEWACAYKGVQGEDRKPAASGGKVLGATFGNDRGDDAVIEFATPAVANAHLYLRAATALNKPTRWKVSIDGKNPVRVEIEPTGGWGEKDEHFRWVHTEIGELIAGGHTLRLEAAGRACNTNFDGFYITGKPFDPPTTASGDSLAQDRIEQIAYRPARQVIDGVPFQFLDPDRNYGCGVLIARRPNENNDPATEIAIPIPDSGANLIHFCGQIAGRLDVTTDPKPLAEYELHFDDGRTERIPLTPHDIVQPTWTGPHILTHRLPQDHTLIKVIFRPKGHRGNAVLLGITLETFPEQGPRYQLTGSSLFYGTRGHAVIAADGFVPDSGTPGLVRTIRLLPGESTTIAVTMSLTENLESSEQLAYEWASKNDAFEIHQRTYQKWFDENCPRFECDDPYITKMYWYRWFVARHCLSRAAAGNLPFPYFFEGTHEGHFPRLIAFSSPHIITEARWLRDPQYAFGQVRNHARNADDENRFFISSRANSKGGEYNNWITKSAWEAFWVHPDRAFLEEIVDALAADVLGTLERYDVDKDFLPTPKNHWTTGMEFQPSFWYFTDYDDTQTEARLERGDFVAYLYGNANAVAQAYRFIENETQARQFDDIARQIRENCLAKMWDDADRFCYAVREDDNAVARTREIVGFYPFMSRLIPDEPRFMAMLKYLVDPDEFWTTWPPATASKSCPAYTPEIGVWPAAGGKRHDCMWNGPFWPHAASVMLDVVAAVIQDYRQEYVTPEHFWHMFDRYTHVQFEGNDLSNPVTYEYYNGETGFPEGIPDYFHSTYCDLIIKYLVGLQPDNTDEIIIRPIPGHVSRFALRGVRYRGHDLDIVYSDRRNLFGQRRGLTVWVDGQRAGRANGLKTLTIQLPQSESVEEEPIPELNIYGEEIQTR